LRALVNKTLLKSVKNFTIFSYISLTPKRFPPLPAKLPGKVLGFVWKREEEFETKEGTNGKNR